MSTSSLKREHEYVGVGLPHLGNAPLNNSNDSFGVCAFVLPMAFCSSFQFDMHATSILYIHAQFYSSCSLHSLPGENRKQCTTPPTSFYHEPQALDRLQKYNDSGFYRTPSVSSILHDSRNQFFVHCKVLMYLKYFQCFQAYLNTVSFYSRFQVHVHRFFSSLFHCQVWFGCDMFLYVKSKGYYIVGFYSTGLLFSSQFQRTFESNNLWIICLNSKSIICFTQPFLMKCLHVQKSTRPKNP